MDLVYEEAVRESLEDSQETLKAQESNSTEPVNDINRKTEESFQKLEDEISKTYNVLEAQASTWGSWISTSISNLKVNDVINETKKQVESLHIDEKLQETKKSLAKNLDSIQKHIVTDENAAKSKDMLNMLSQKTNKYLDDLDKDLERVENTAGAYVSKFGQFLKENILVAAPEDMDELIDDKDAELLFNVNGTTEGKLSATRTEAQLFTLHTSPDLYLTEDKDPDFETFKSTFDVEQKTDEITKLVKENKNLKKLSTELVPAKVKYPEFWARYFYMHDKILQQESNRKKLLTEKNSNSDKEDLSWGDEDEEDEDSHDTKKSSTSSEGGYELQSVDSSTVEVHKKAKESKTASPLSKETKKETEQTHEEQDEDDDDDDWE